MTPNKNNLTPKAAIKWLEELRTLSEHRGGDPSTKYKIRYMFKYIEDVLKYQEILPPTVDEKGRFTCPRCGKRMMAYDATVDDYAFCPCCGQRWQENIDFETIQEED